MHASIIFSQEQNLDIPKVVQKKKDGKQDLELFESLLLREYYACKYKIFGKLLGKVIFASVWRRSLVTKSDLKFIFEKLGQMKSFDLFFDYYQSELKRQSYEMAAREAAAEEAVRKEWK